MVRRLLYGSELLTQLRAANGSFPRSPPNPGHTISFKTATGQTGVALATHVAFDLLVNSRDR
jgi:hypothetical protein